MVHMGHHQICHHKNNAKDHWVIYIRPGWIRVICTMVIMATGLVYVAPQISLAQSKLPNILPHSVAGSYGDNVKQISFAQDRHANDPTLVLTLGKGDVVDVGGAVSDVMIADPNLIDVVALQANRLYVVGNQAGDTNIIVLDANGDVIKRMNIHVRVDISTISETLKDLFPNEKVDVSAVNDQIILRGQVSNPGVASQIRDVVSRFVRRSTGDSSGGSGSSSGSSGSDDDEGGLFGLVINMMTVKGEQQVMLQVKILELARTALKEFGLETQLNDIGGASSFSSGGDLANLSVASGAGLTQAPFATGQIFLDTGIGGASPFNLLANLLETRGLVKTLAEPNLTAISGQEAGFLAGGQFPLPSIPDNDIQASTNVVLQPFGVALDFVPTVVSEDRIALHLRTEVSSLAPENSISIGDPAINIPGLSIRRAETNIELGSGSTMMIAGLIQSDYVRGLTGLPGIFDTPILGDLVKSKSFRRNESELVIMVTPYIVKPFSDQNKARHVSKEGNDPLSLSFVDNMTRIYGPRFRLNSEKDKKVGYVLD